MIEIFWEEYGLIRKASGELTLAELEKHFDELSNDVRVETLHYSISDFSDCVSVAFTADELEKIAAMGHKEVIRRVKGFRAAYVVTAPEVRGVIVNYLQQDPVRWPSKIFATIEEAREWATRLYT